MKTPAFFDLHEPGVLSFAQESLTVKHGIVSRTLLVAPAARVVLFRFAAGQELTEHTNPARALVQVLEGACEFSVAGKTHALQPGDLLHLPPGAPHAVRAAESFTMLLILLPERPEA
jgi:quercetin dioxygenase-like cupin family protein